MKKYFSLLALSFLVSCSNVNQNDLISTEQQTTENQQVNAFKREIISATLGDAPNFAQTSNGNFLSVVSRNYGRGAKAGALIEFMYPNYAKDNLWDAYNGIYYNGKIQWLHDMKLVKQSIKEDSGIIISEFASNDSKLNVKTYDVALRDNDTHVRHLEITNKSGETLKDLDLFFYEYFTINYLGAGDDLNYDEQNGYLVHTQNNNTTFTIGSDKTPVQWQCGGVGNIINSQLDARKDAEDGELRNNLSAKGRVGLGVNGNIGHKITQIRPNEKFSINYFISAGKTRDESIANFNKSKVRTWENVEANDLTFWKNWLSKARMPNTDDKTMKVYKRALITMKQDTVNNGAVMAAPTLLTPVYSFTWPRDGAVTTSAYLEAGYTEEARKFIDFIIAMQKDNGSWAVNYFTDGSRPLWDFGDRKNEHDQVGTVNWIIYEYYQHTKDLNWLKIKWNTVKRASDYLAGYVEEKNLISPCRDLWELHTDKTWAFTNAAVYAGFDSAAKIAGIVGDNQSKIKYQGYADNIKKSINDYLWDSKAEYFIRGINPKTNEKDNKIEAANLGLAYPFNVLDYNDPKMIKTADKIYQTLKSPQNGIRRYTDDKYYDGNPWPATTDWLAIYYAKQGNKQKAIQLHNAITGYAYQTDSLMLGEQFDEKRKLWVSAFPLTWSESKYVLATLDIYGNQK